MLGGHSCFGRFPEGHYPINFLMSNRQASIAVGHAEYRNFLLARKSGGLGSDKRQDLSLLPVKVPTVIEHKCFKSGQRVAGF